MKDDHAFAAKLRSLAVQHLGITPRKTQTTAAALLQRRVIVEMETGEGKTLTVAMAAIAMATTGKRVYVATANDYLAARDAEAMNPLFEGYGLRASSLSSTLPREPRRSVYACEIIYGTIRELGFDSLRDELESRKNGSSASNLVPKSLSLIVDEADSVLIDEALSPLVINEVGFEQTAEKTMLYRWSAIQAAQMSIGRDYVIHSASNAIALTDQGIARIVRSLMPTEMAEFRMHDILNSLERAIDVASRYQRDAHYLIRNNQVMLIDSNTGRIASSKKLSSGLHQAIEAKERLPITNSGKTTARMSIQELVNRMPHLSGVTGTAFEERRELRTVYGLQVKRSYPHVPSRRIRLSTRVFADNHQKLIGIVNETRDLLFSGRAVLVGTQTIDQSERISRLMDDQGITHVVLNARQSSDEAGIVALAGQSKRVTVATNMAGRGTDIRISEDVREAGGLHVVVAEPHLIARIDRQLAGRCARQGDPGTVRHYLAPDDQLFKIASQQSYLKRFGRQVSRLEFVWRAIRSQRMIGRLQREHRYRLAASESQLAEDFEELSLSPHLDRPTADD